MQHHYVINWSYLAHHSILHRKEVDISGFLIRVFASFSLFMVNHACSNLLLKTADSVYNYYHSFKTAIHIVGEKKKLSSKWKWILICKRIEHIRSVLAALQWLTSFIFRNDLSPLSFFYTKPWRGFKNTITCCFMWSSPKGNKKRQVCQLSVTPQNFGTHYSIIIALLMSISVNHSAHLPDYK